MRKSHNLHGSAPSKVLSSQTFTFWGLDLVRGWRKVCIPAVKSDMTWRNLFPGLLSSGNSLSGLSDLSPLPPSSGLGTGGSCEFF